MTDEEKKAKQKAYWSTMHQIQIHALLCVILMGLTFFIGDTLATNKNWFIKSMCQFPTLYFGLKFLGSLGHAMIHAHNFNEIK